MKRTLHWPGGSFVLSRPYVRSWASDALPTSHGKTSARSTSDASSGALLDAVAGAVHFSAAQYVKAPAALAAITAIRYQTCASAISSSPGASLYSGDHSRCRVPPTKITLPVCSAINRAAHGK